MKYIIIVTHVFTLSLNNRKVFRGLLGLSRGKEKTEKIITLSEAVAVDCYQIGGIYHAYIIIVYNL